MRPPRLRAPAKPYDYTDADANKEVLAAASLQADRLRAVERGLLATPEGREWVWALLKDCDVWVDGQRDLLPFDQGRREVGLQLMRQFARVAPADFARIFSENDR